jgi:hypothetical protein
MQTTQTLTLLQDTLTRFHDNKSVFVDLNIRTDFNIPKLHSLQHYRPSIELFGTTDNYNTEASEWLHIDLAKDAYRAMNHKDEYPQMTLWLERQEKIAHHELYIDWCLAGRPRLSHDAPMPDRHTHIKMAKHPSVRAVPLATLDCEYGAHRFRHELTVFIARENYSTLTPAQLLNTARNIKLPFQTLPVFHKIKFWNPDAQGRTHAPKTLDVAHILPGRIKPKQEQWKPGQFDTILVKTPHMRNDKSGVHRACPISLKRYSSYVSIESGFRVAQIRVVFRILPKASAILFPTHSLTTVPKHLAYVEWFSPFTHNPDNTHGMYKISRSFKEGERLASVIPVHDVVRSVVLFPKFGAVAPREWSTSTVLEECTTFYVNPFTDRHSYLNLY